MGYFNWYGEDKTKHLSHHGIKGQRWGVRRFQNYDGTRIGSSEKGSKDSKPKKSTSVKTNNTEKLIKDKGVEDAYGYITYKTDKGVNVNIRNDWHNPATNKYEPLEPERKEEMIKGAAKAIDYISNDKNLSEITDAVVNNMKNDKWAPEQENLSDKQLKDNLKLYGMYVNDVAGDNVYVEMNYEHKDFFSDSAIYGDHSIDMEGTYNMKTKKFTPSTYNSING